MRGWILAAVISTGLAVSLTACGSDGAGSGASSSSPASPASQDFNEQDATFASNMITHHRQAVQMAGLAATRSSDAKVLDLAAKIERAQAPEIDTMSGWLEAWGKPVPHEMSGTSDMDVGGGTSGMMSDADMKKLEGTKGAEFDRMLLTMMIAHHQGAVRASWTELEEGENADAKAMAQTIIDDQNAEIATMRTMLK
jgi:uncharacterized protein (DUF305 family)